METDNIKEGSDLSEKCLKSEKIYDGCVLHIRRDEVLLPDGNCAVREVNHHIGAVCVIPVDENGDVVMERQYRYPLNRVVLEIPAGKLDYRDEDRLEAAKRELREETGYTADEWIDLGIFYPAAAYSDEKITLYLARGLHKGERELDDDEFIDVYKVPLEELVEDVMSGAVTDNKTQMAILKVAEFIRREKQKEN